MDIRDLSRQDCSQPDQILEIGGLYLNQTVLFSRSLKMAISYTCKRVSYIILQSEGSGATLTTENVASITLMQFSRASIHA